MGSNLIGVIGILGIDDNDGMKGDRCHLGGHNLATDAVEHDLEEGKVGAG
jgi:hypothetical protein